MIGFGPGGFIDTLHSITFILQGGEGADRTRLDKTGAQAMGHKQTMAAVKERMKQKRDSSCSVYTHPASGETVQAYSTYNIQWNCSCVGTSVADIDITLYSYGGGALHGWSNVPCAQGTFATQFLPSWWNSTSSASAYLQIADSSQPSWATTAGTGPQFSLAWNGTTPVGQSGLSSGNSTGPTVDSVSDTSGSSGVTGGKLAAAVTIPLLAAAIFVIGYIFYSRRKGKTERKRWSAYVDHRLSQISGAQWDSGAGGSGSPARPFSTAHAHSQSLSMSQQGSRPSLSGRPISSYSFGANNLAGVGSHMHHGDGDSDAYPQSFPSDPNGPATASTCRPTSSFYARDGHSAMEAPLASGESFNSLERNSMVMTQSRQIGNRGDHVSRISFAESTFTGGDRRSKRMSYFNNGNGSVSSPNVHRYKNSVAASISSVPKIPPAAGFDVTQGVDSSAPRPLSSTDINGAVQLRGHSSHPSNASASSPFDHSGSVSDPDGMANDNTHPPSKSRKANITISTSMPFMNQPQGRESILSPDELLQAYASKATATMGQSETEYFDTEILEDQQQTNVGGKKGKLAGMFGLAR